MNRVNWIGPVNIFENLPGMEVTLLTPQGDADKQAILDALSDAGVRDRMAFFEDTTALRIDFPESLQWTATGALCLSVTDGETSTPACFWLVEVEGPDPRTYVWWSRQDDPNSAIPWNP